MAFISLLYHRDTTCVIFELISGNLIWLDLYTSMLVKTYNINLNFTVKSDHY